MAFGRHGNVSQEERDSDNFINEYLRYVEYTEPPIAFHKWTAVGCIAAALQRKVYLKWGMEKVYPNLYIVLLGPAAQTRKSTALKIGEDLVRALDIPMIGQDNSPEAIIRNIKDAYSTFDDGTSITSQSAMCCFASELAVFLGNQKSDLQAYLTDWWDSPQDWKRSTKHQGTDDISGLCFNLVGAMAPDWIPHVFTAESIGGGFTSRIVFVPESRKAKIITNPNKYPERLDSRDKLINDLGRIHHMSGAFEMTEEAQEFYEGWYLSDDTDMQNGVFAVPDRAFHTYCGRRSVVLRKLAMCLSAAESGSMKLEVEHLREALSMMTDVEGRMPGLFAAVGRSSHARQLSLVSTMVKARGTATRAEILATLYQDITSSDLDEVEMILDGMKYVKIIKDGGTTIYQWVGPS